MGGLALPLRASAFLEVEQPVVLLGKSWSKETVPLTPEARAPDPSFPCTARAVSSRKDRGQQAGEQAGAQGRAQPSTAGRPWAQPGQAPSQPFLSGLNGVLQKKREKPAYLKTIL